MKTDALIDLLATGAGPVQRNPVARRFGPAVAVGAACSFAMMRLTLGINPALTDFLALPAFWIKMIENYDRWFRTAVGTAENLAAEAVRTGRRWLHGIGPMRAASS